MTEGTKALNSSVSTLKKNPGRIGRLVKAAKLLIVPPKQYATGKARQVLDAAVSKLKTKRGLNGVVGEGAGPFSDKALGIKTVEKKAHMNKEAEVSKGTKDKALAASAVASGALLGGGLTHDLKKSRITSRMGTKGAYKHMGNPSIEGAEKRLANSGKTLRRMAKPLRRAGIKGAIVGGLAGAALGAAHLKKEAAAAPAVVPKQEFLGKGALPASVKDVSPKAVLKRKLGKAGNIAVAVGGTAALVGAVKDRMEKKAEKKKDSNVIGGAIGGASVAATVRSTKDTGKALSGMGKQLRYMAANGQPSPNKVGFHMALKSFEKPINRRALRAAGKGGAAGALAAAAYDRLKGHKKEAAEKIVHNGKKIRRGDVTSAASTMGAISGTLTAIGNRRNPKGILKEVAKSALSGGALGGTYGVARKGLRTVRGEKSMDPREFDKLKGHKKQAAEKRKGTVASATANMAGLNAGMQVAGNIMSAQANKKMGIPVGKAHYVSRVPAAAAVGAAMGYGFGKVREAYREKKSLKKQAAAKLEHNGKTYRKGTVGSAATKMGVVGALTGALQAKKYGMPGGLTTAQGAIGGAALGGAYALARKALRKAHGEKSLSPGEFKEMKKAKRMKELLG